MSKFDRNWIKDGLEKLCTNKQTNRQTDRQANSHYENNGHLAVNQYALDAFSSSTGGGVKASGLQVFTGSHSQIA